MSEITTELIGINLGEDEERKFFGAILANNGKIYCPPSQEEAQVLEIDPENKDVPCRLFGDDFGTGTNSKYWSGALADNGRIYCPPYQSTGTHVLEIDPIADTATEVGDNLGAGVDGKYAGSILANGRIYCPPYGSDVTHVLEITPAVIGGAAATTDATFGSDLGGASEKYWTGVLAPSNGRIYCPPVRATQVLEIDPEGGNTQTVGGAITGATKYNSAILYTNPASVNNGKIYCPPRNATHVLEIEPLEGGGATITEVGDEFGVHAKYRSGVLANNGRIYCPPASTSVNVTQVLEIDPTETDVVVTEVGSVLDDGLVYYSAVLANNGKIYCTPYSVDATRVLEITPLDGGGATTRLVGSDLSEANAKYWASALANNGKIYCVPVDATRVLEINIPKAINPPSGGGGGGNGGNGGNGKKEEDKKDNLPLILGLTLGLGLPILAIAIYYLVFFVFI